MKTVIGLSLSLLVAGLVGLTNMVCTKAFAGEERASAVHEHENIKLPTKRLMVEIEKRMYNILEGILVGNFKYVKQEAAAVTEKANQINENFFPRNPEIDAWYKRSKDLDPSNIEAIKKLKEEFNAYMRRIDAGVQEIQKAADTGDTEATFQAYSGLLTKACFECHRRLRDTK
ncbi:MAG TPA: cytochrome c [Candidatus Wunengus sp. YC63]|uniref:cytochrome c n=1 Tax=unclassified Candidatus Wunengus TaxID=3367695 RepID=UPI0040274243